MTQSSQKKIAVRIETRRKVEAIATSKRWTLSETIDALCDTFMAAEGIAVEPRARRRLKPHAA